VKNDARRVDTASIYGTAYLVPALRKKIGSRGSNGEEGEGRKVRRNRRGGKIGKVRGKRCE